MPRPKSQPPACQTQCEVTEEMSVKQTPKAKYTQSFARSAIAPHTIARETPAKTTSNRYAAEPGIVVKKEYGAAPTVSNESADGKNPCVPMTALPSPKAMPKPTAQ